MKVEVLRKCCASGIFILTNILFLAIVNPVCDMVEYSYLNYGHLRIKYIVSIVTMVFAIVVLVTFLLMRLKKQFGKIGLISVYSLMASVFWTVLILSVMDYSLSWIDFHTSGGILIVYFYLVPISFMAVALLYKWKQKQ